MDLQVTQVFINGREMPVMSLVLVVDPKLCMHVWHIQIVLQIGYKSHRAKFAFCSSSQAGWSLAGDLLCMQAPTMGQTSAH